jgi:hypothetical protein
MPLTSNDIKTVDSAIAESDPIRVMTFEGSGEVINSRVGIGIRGTSVTNFQASGFTHDYGPNIIFS